MFIRITSALCIAYLCSTAVAQSNDDGRWTKYSCDNNDPAKCQLFGLRGNYNCEEGRCRCKPGSRYLESAYVCHLTNTKLNDNCVLPLDCAVQFSTCKEDVDNQGAKTCQCDVGRNKDGSECNKKCNSSECDENEYCKDGNCKCREDRTYSLVERKCMPINCSRDQPCPGNNLECVEGICNKINPSGDDGGRGEQPGQSGNKDGSDSSMSVTTIVVIAIGVIVSLILLGVLVYFAVNTKCFKYRLVSTT